MKKVSHIKSTDILIGIIFVIIYFQIYWHYWLVKLLKGYVINTFLPIFVLFCLFLFREFVSHKISFAKRKTYNVFLPLILYAAFATISILLNEEGGNIKSFLIYVYSPLLIFIGILGLHNIRKNDSVKFLIRILFIVGIIFSTYVTIIFSINPQDLLAMPAIETNRGEIKTTTGASFSVGDLAADRYTIPGISSTTYGPLLVPLIFAGFYFRRYAKGKIKHSIYTALVLLLMFCVFKTVSRGPFIAMIAGMTYLGWRKWLKTKEIVFIASVFVISLLTFAKLTLLRLLITIAIFIPFHIPFLDKDAMYLLLEDSRIITIGETLSYVSEHPLLGMGMTNLINLQNLSYGKEHNNYLSIAASFGSLTLVFYLLFLFLLFIMAQKAIKRLSWNPTSKDLGIVLSAGYLSMMVYLNFAPAEFHFIWIWFGFTAAWLRNSEEETLLKRNPQIVERVL